MSGSREVQRYRNSLTRKYDGRKNMWLIFVDGIVIVALALFLIFRVVLGISTVDGTSMAPTLRNGQKLIFFRLNPTYEIGDIICMRMPNGDQYVKRIRAGPGDTIELTGDAVYVNGQEIEEEYANGKTELQEDTVEYPMKLDEEQYFVMGDNREHSIDSRSFGAIVIYQIQGRILGNYD